MPTKFSRRLCLRPTAPEFLARVTRPNLVLILVFSFIQLINASGTGKGSRKSSSWMSALQQGASTVSGKLMEKANQNPITSGIIATAALGLVYWQRSGNNQVGSPQITPGQLVHESTKGEHNEDSTPITEPGAVATPLIRSRSSSVTSDAASIRSIATNESVAPLANCCDDRAPDVPAPINNSESDAERRRKTGNHDAKKRPVAKSKRIMIHGEKYHVNFTRTCYTKDEGIVKYEAPDFWMTLRTFPEKWKHHKQVKTIVWRIPNNSRARTQCRDLKLSPVVTKFKKLIECKTGNRELTFQNSVMKRKLLLQALGLRAMRQKSLKNYEYPTHWRLVITRVCNGVEKKLYDRNYLYASIDLEDHLQPGTKFVFSRLEGKGIPGWIQKDAERNR